MSVSRNVKGSLFVDYVRMIRGNKKVDWSGELRPEDLSYLVQKIDPSGWYPMTSFERMGNAILKHVAGGSLDAVRMWGRLSVDALRAQTPELVAEDNPIETLQRFRVLRSTFFDFEALKVQTLHDDEARILVHYYMGAMAEQAASYQTMGFFERLLELAGAKTVEARFERESWLGHEKTLLALDWALT